ncbi:MAG: hypothetical protein ABIO70_02925 [Pseudomonadota bacterium]
MRPRSSRYSPRSLASEDLEALLVGREVLASSIVAGFKGSILEGSARFELLVGPRGAGKSHLIGVLQHRLESDAEMAERCVVASLDEEEHVASLLDLLARVLAALPARSGEPDPRQQAAGLRTSPGIEGERRAVAMIRGQLEGRALLVITENFDRTLDALGRAGQARLRALLQTEGRWSLLASTQRVTESLRRSDHPFFHTFQERLVPPLDPLQCRELLRRLARLHGCQELVEALSSGRGLARVRAIHHLVGGSPRAMALIFPYLEDVSLDALERSFYALADELTPYFQQQMTARSPAQQPILERLSENWRPLSVTEIAQATFTSPQSTSGQLKKLSVDGLVQRLSLGRESFYEIADPLWRIARSMKRPDLAPSAFLRFLALWHPVGEWAHGSPPAPAVSLVDWARVREEFGFQPNTDEFLGTASAEVLQAISGGSQAAAEATAEACFLKHPCASSAELLLVALGDDHHKERFAEVAEEIFERFGAEAVALAFFAFVRSPDRDLRGLRERAGPAMRAIALDASRRSLVDLALLWEGLDGEEDLLAAASRVRPLLGLVGSQRGLLAALRDHGKARCIQALEPAFQESDDGGDRLALLWALVETGARDLAAQRLETWSQGMEAGLERARLGARGALLLGHPANALSAAREAIAVAPADERSWILVSEVAAATQDRALILEVARWLDRRHPELPLFGLLAGLGEFATGAYQEAARRARALPVHLVTAAAGLGPTSALDAAVEVDWETLHPGALAFALFVLDPEELLALHPGEAPSPAVARARVLAANLAGRVVEGWAAGGDEGTGLVLQAWAARILSGPPDWARARFAALCADLGAQEACLLSSALSFVAVGFVAHGLDRGALEAVMLDIGSSPTARPPWLDALLALPADARPFARLAAPERALLRELLGGAGLPGQALLAKLPAEPTPVG